MKDLIEREKAIELVADEIWHYPNECYKSLNIFENAKDLAKHALRGVPSAQPEIIRCKDCKFWMPYDWMFSEIWRSQNINDYPEDEIGCEYCDMTMKADDFCSRAERRTDD